MSHELRTPMNAIIGLTRLVMRRAKEILPPREHDNLGKILISAEHLLALINDILDLSKIEAGRMEVHPVNIQLAELVDACLRTVDGIALIEQLQQAPQSQQIPIIVLTAKTLTTPEQALLEESVRTVIQKRGLDRETLIQELRGLLQTYRGPTAKGGICTAQYDRQDMGE
jgi:signal transduction histidine kinase